ncbi:MAG: hypothetical protein ACTHMC_12585, partial [Pseudobacter sp.]|uniref:hypothetical protein n=1 Tax=Pseudobacter sp. TaxID=2045420 RepID=UPI003F7CFD6B
EGGGASVGLFWRAAAAVAKMFGLGWQRMYNAAVNLPNCLEYLWAKDLRGLTFEYLLSCGATDLEAAYAQSFAGAR